MVRHGLPHLAYDFQHVLALIGCVRRCWQRVGSFQWCSRAWPLSLSSGCMASRHEVESAKCANDDTAVEISKPVGHRSRRPHHMVEAGRWSRGARAAYERRPRVDTVQPLTVDRSEACLPHRDVHRRSARARSLGVACGSGCGYLHGRRTSYDLIAHARRTTSGLARCCKANHARRQPKLRAASAEASTSPCADVCRSDRRLPLFPPLGAWGSARWRCGSRHGPAGGGRDVARGWTRQMGMESCDTRLRSSSCMGQCNICSREVMRKRRARGASYASFFDGPGKSGVHVVGWCVFV